MALALNNLKRVDMPLNKETKPNLIIIGSFNINEGIELNTANYCDFMDKTYFVWCGSQSCSFKVKCVFMRVNAPSQVS